MKRQEKDRKENQKDKKKESVYKPKEKQGKKTRTKKGRHAKEVQQTAKFLIELLHFTASSVRASQQKEKLLETFRVPKRKTDRIFAAPVGRGGHRKP